MTTNEPSPLGSECNAELGQALEDAADECLAALSGVDTHDVNLRDHPKAWAAIEAFAAKVRADERERCQRTCRSMSFEFGPESPERDALQRVATRLDMPEYGA